VRILHLIDPASPGGGPGTLRLVAGVLGRTAGADHDVLIVGNSRHLAMARRCGLKPLGCIAAPLNRPALGRSGLRSFLRAWEPVSGAYDLLHAWTLPAADLAVLAARRRPVLASAMVEPARLGGPLEAWCLRRLRRRQVPVLAATAAVRSRLETAGWDRGLLSLLPPAVDVEAIGLEQRALLRERWGADETTFVVALLGEPAAWADGRFAINAMGRMALTGRDVRLVLHHAATSVDDLRRWLARLGIGGIVIVDDSVAEPWRVVAGLDAALIASRSGSRAAGPAVTPVLWAMAAGLPVVAQATDTLAGIVDDGASGRLFEAGDYNGAAARMLSLYDDARGAAGMGDAGRAIAERRFRIAGFTARLEAVYGQCAGREPIRVPEAPATQTEPREPRTHDFAVRATPS
jgi:glycosyltransferase involved in cell wall biosynthesis